MPLSHFRCLFYVYFMMLLAGCSLLTPVHAPTINKYVLDQLPAPHPVSHPGAKSLAVMVPDVKPIYNGTQMVYSLIPHQVNYFSKNEWAETPSQMLQLLLVQTLRQTKNFREVLSAPTTVYYDYVLNTQLLSLQQNFFKQKSQAAFSDSQFRVSIRVELCHATNNKIIAAKTFTATKIVPRGHFYTGVMAANIAVARLLGEISDFTIKSLPATTHR